MNNRNILLVFAICSLLLILIPSAFTDGGKHLFSYSTLFAVLLLCPQYLVLYIATFFIKPESFNTVTTSAKWIFGINTFMILGKMGMGIPVIVFLEFLYIFSLITKLLINRFSSKVK